LLNLGSAALKTALSGEFDEELLPEIVIACTKMPKSSERDSCMNAIEIFLLQKMTTISEAIPTTHSFSPICEAGVNVLKHREVESSKSSFIVPCSQFGNFSLALLEFMTSEWDDFGKNCHFSVVPVISLLKASVLTHFHDDHLSCELCLKTAQTLSKASKSLIFGPSTKKKPN